MVPSTPKGITILTCPRSILSISNCTVPAENANQVGSSPIACTPTMSLLLTVKLGDCKAKMDGLSLFSATYLLCFLILFLYSSLAWACCRLKHYVRRRQLFTHPKQASQAAPSQGRRGRLSLPTSLPPPPQKIGKLESPPSITSLKMYCAPSLPPLSRTNLPSPRDSCLGIRRRR